MIAASFEVGQPGGTVRPPKTVNHDLNHDLKAVKMLFLAAKRDGLISENPAEDVKIVAQRGEKRSRRPFSLECKRLRLTVPKIQDVLTGDLGQVRIGQRTLLISAPSCAWPGSLSGFSLSFFGAHSGSSSKQTILPNYSASPSAPSFSHFQS
jgi:hypothetical protein